MPTAFRPLNPALVTADRRAQSRSAVNAEVVADYAEAMQAGATFPPVTVYHDGETYWLADGFHRIDAALQAGVASILADVRKGGLRDAVLFSVGANGVHGLRRTNDDKRAAVMTLLNDPEWSLWSDREIARRCGVSAPLVASLRPSVSALQMDAPRLVERGGKTFEQNTARIGKRAGAVPAVQVEVAPPASDPVPSNVISLGAQLVPVQVEVAPPVTAIFRGRSDFQIGFQALVRDALRLYQCRW